MSELIIELAAVHLLKYPSELIIAIVILYSACSVADEKTTSSQPEI